jgi:hypothetical protein
MILNVNFGIEGLIKRERERKIRWATKLAHKQAHLTNIERSSFGIKSYIRIIPQHRVSYQLVIKK